MDLKNSGPCITDKKELVEQAYRGLSTDLRRVLLKRHCCDGAMGGILK